MLNTSFEVFRSHQEFLLLVLPQNTQGYPVRNRSHGVERGLAQLMAREHGYHSNEPVVRNQGVTRERDHPLPLGPILFGDARVADDGIRQVRDTLLSDLADLEFADWDTAVCAVEVRIEPSTRL